MMIDMVSRIKESMEEELFLNKTFFTNYKEFMVIDSSLTFKNFNNDDIHKCINLILTNLIHKSKLVAEASLINNYFFLSVSMRSFIESYVILNIILLDSSGTCASEYFKYYNKISILNTILSVEKKNIDIFLKENENLLLGLFGTAELNPLMNMKNKYDFSDYSWAKKIFPNKRVTMCTMINHLKKKKVILDNSIYESFQKFSNIIHSNNIVGNLRGSINLQESNYTCMKEIILFLDSIYSKIYENYSQSAKEKLHLCSLNEFHLVK